MEPANMDFDEAGAELPGGELRGLGGLGFDGVTLETHRGDDEASQYNEREKSANRGHHVVSRKRSKKTVEKRSSEFATIARKTEFVVNGKLPRRGEFAN
jgi:hypothetical protein